MPKDDENITLDDCRKIFESSTETYDDTTWLIAARDKIYSILRSPMKEEYTHEAFKWIAQLSIVFGDFSWISPNEKLTLEEAKMLSCFVLLSFSEIEILLPLIQRHLTNGDEVEIEEGKILARPATVEEYDRFGDHLVILESFIRLLVQNENEDKDNYQRLECLSSAEVANLLDKLKEIVIQLSEYLELVHKNWLILCEKYKDSEKFSSAKGALRIMCVWLSEEPQLFKPQCKSFLIDLIIKTILLDESSMQADILILALHSICTYSSEDDELIIVLRKHPQHKEALEKYLRYVEKERSRSGNERHQQKKFKLRCSMIKDLLSEH